MGAEETSRLNADSAVGHCSMKTSRSHVLHLTTNLYSSAMVSQQNERQLATDECPDGPRHLPWRLGTLAGTLTGKVNSDRDDRDVLDLRLLHEVLQEPVLPGLHRLHAQPQAAVRQLLQCPSE